MRTQKWLAHIQNGGSLQDIMTFEHLVNARMHAQCMQVCMLSACKSFVVCKSACSVHASHLLLCWSCCSMRFGLQVSAIINHKN